MVRTQGERDLGSPRLSSTFAPVHTMEPDSRSHFSVDKPVPPHLWRVSFSGEQPPKGKFDLPLHEFLQQARIYQRANNFSDARLLSSMLFLLGGQAQRWFMNAERHIQTYADFESEIRAEFLPPGNDLLLLSEIERFKQRKDQPLSSYLIDLEGKFNAFQAPLSEAHKVHFAQRNIFPHMLWLSQPVR